jgi:hypothetical protein
MHADAVLIPAGPPVGAVVLMLPTGPSSADSMTRKNSSPSEVVRAPVAAHSR